VTPVTPPSKMRIDFCDFLINNTKVQPLQEPVVKHLLQKKPLINPYYTTFEKPPRKLAPNLSFTEEFGASFLGSAIFDRHKLMTYN
jgi:hypothetical protein